MSLLDVESGPWNLSQLPLSESIEFNDSHIASPRDDVSLEDHPVRAWIRGKILVRSHGNYVDSNVCLESQLTQGFPSQHRFRENPGSDESLLRPAEGLSHAGIDPYPKEASPRYVASSFRDSIARACAQRSITVYMVAPRTLLQGKVYADQSLTVESGAARHVSAILETGKSLEVTVDVLSGGAVDIFLMNSENKIDWDKYVEGQSQGFIYISQGSTLKAKYFRYVFIVPQKDTYFVVVSNRGGIPGGATPTGDVVAYVKMLAR